MRDAQSENKDMKETDTPSSEQEGLSESGMRAMQGVDDSTSKLNDIVEKKDQSDQVSAKDDDPQPDDELIDITTHHKKSPEHLPNVESEPRSLKVPKEAGSKESKEGMGLNPPREFRPGGPEGGG